VQISAEIVHLKINLAKKKVGSDHAGNILREEYTINRYVNPEVRTEYWDQHCISEHGSILPDDERIINAGNMRTVWPEFQCWFFSLVSPAKMVVLVAWNGKTCDLKWLWRLTQAPNSRYSLPDNIKYFLDPYHVIVFCFVFYVKFNTTSYVHTYGGTTCIRSSSQDDTDGTSSIVLPCTSS